MVIFLPIIVLPIIKIYCRIVVHQCFKDIARFYLLLLLLQLLLLLFLSSSSLLQWLRLIRLFLFACNVGNVVNGVFKEITSKPASKIMNSNEVIKWIKKANQISVAPNTDDQLQLLLPWVSSFVSEANM